MTLLACDPNGMKLGCPTNIAFGFNDPETLYVANRGRYDITWAVVGRMGQSLPNWGQTAEGRGSVDR